RATTVHGHERVDAVRGCVALRRGPLVYALEAADQEPGVVVDDLRVDADAPFTAQHRPDLLGGVTVLRFPARHAGSPVTATAIPYYAWANRGARPMRVWLPLT
ncbi:MAG: glycoside hydrolase family 127 protein, partial [Candidatus Dormibacteraeota bacterium]|nr:glycoside hydrolase family 127 protein [Candidatus Dormibacteraeota bacterium]